MLKVLAKTTTRKEGSSVTDTIITLNEQTLKNQLGELVRASVEETLNKMLDAEADQLANAGKYERTALHSRCIIRVVPYLAVVN